MRQLLIGLSVTAIFAAGCVAGASRWGVPRAEAREDQRWAYFCFEAGTANEIHTKANAAGARGWELVSSATNAAGSVIWCFRQPKG